MIGNVSSVRYDGLSNKTVVELTLDGNVAEQIESLQQKPVSVDIQPYRQKRSLNANAYAWQLIGQLAEKMQLPAAEIYRNYIKTIGVFRDIEVTENAEFPLKTVWQAHGLGWLAETVDYAERDGFIIMRLYYGSSSYNTKQMSRLIDAIISDCNSVGIPTLPYEGVEKLKQSWRHK